MDVAEAADWLALSPRTTGLFTDFDGTLSPIVRRPEIAAPLPGVPELLKQLGAQMLLVAVVSGRPAAWLVETLQLGRTGGDAAGGLVQAFGLHGLEHWAGGQIEVDEAAIAWQPAIAEARARAMAADVEGVEVENKQYGVTLHWRNAPDPEGAAERAKQLAGHLGETTGLIPRTGKSSVELVPPIGIDKGTVVRRWVESAAGDARRVAFLGDDASDVLAFAAIDRLVSGDASATSPVAGLKIGVAGNEVPPELIERADLVLSAPQEAVQLLVELAKRLAVAGRTGAG
jgi:trehalose 6-phosphate phosphatase